MSMSRKHFQALADIVAEYAEGGEGVGVERLAHDLATFCREQNPHFDRDRFMRACGVGHLAAN